MEVAFTVSGHLQGQKPSIKFQQKANKKNGKRTVEGQWNENRLSQASDGGYDDPDSYHKDVLPQPLALENMLICPLLPALLVVMLRI